jgi:DNA gyrase subunit A
VRRFTDDNYLLMATHKGVVKKTALKDYSRPKSGGIIGIAIDEGDSLIGVVQVKAGDEVVLATKNGMAIRFDEADARAMGRNTYGVKGITLTGGDEVVGMVVADPEGDLLTMCEKGYGKRTPFGANIAGEPEEEESGDRDQESGVRSQESGVRSQEPGVSDQASPGMSEAIPGGEAPGEPGEDGPVDRSSMRYRKQRRGGKGVRDIRTTERNGPVVGVIAVRDGDDIMLITAQGMVNRTHVHEIRRIGRNTQGVRIMNLNEGDKIASIAKVAREAEEPAPENKGPAAPPPSEPAPSEAPPPSDAPPTV